MAIRCGGSLFGKTWPLMLVVLVGGCASLTARKTAPDHARVKIQPSEWVRGHMATWQRVPVVRSIDGVSPQGGGAGPYNLLPGPHTVIVAVEWSNGWTDETALTFTAQAGQQYLLLTYERAPEEPEAQAAVRQRTLAEQAVGLVVFSVLLAPPVSLLTLPYGVVTGVQRLVAQPGTHRPFERCCFVWMQDEASGVVVSGERPGG